jgi:hypothetical protein
LDRGSGLQHVYARLAKTTKPAPFNVFGHLPFHLCLSNAASFDDARRLGIRLRRAEMRIQAARGEFNQVGRQQPREIGILSSELLDAGRPNFWLIRSEPITLPLASIMLPWACRGNIACPNPVTSMR